MCPIDDLPARVVKAHNIHKATIIERYADIVAKAMKNKWENLCYVDLFCGPGICWVEDSGEFVYGSPLIAHAVEPRFSHFVFNDTDQICVEALKARMSQADVVPTMLQEDANDPVTIEKVRKAIPDWTLSLVLLDPQKLNLALGTIGKLTRGEQPMDLLINLPINGLKRSLEHPHKLDLVLGRDWVESCDVNNWSATVRAHFRAKLTGFGYDRSVGKQIFSEHNRSPLYDFIMASRSDLAERFFKEVTRETAHHQMAIPIG